MYNSIELSYDIQDVYDIYNIPIKYTYDKNLDYYIINEADINETDMKRWTVDFRALANINRLKIIKLLADGRKMSVTDIAEYLQISFKATSNHLALLKNLDVVEAQGASGHVFYFFNRQLPKDFQKIIEIALK